LPEEKSPFELSEKVAPYNYSLIIIETSKFYPIALMYAATVEGDPSPGKGNWEVKYFPIDKLPENVHPQDKPDIEKFAK
jgi:hypothetical protein